MITEEYEPAEWPEFTHRVYDAGVEGIGVLAVQHPGSSTWELHPIHLADDADYENDPEVRRPDYSIHSQVNDVKTRDLEKAVAAIRATLEG